MKYNALETNTVRKWQAGGADDHGQLPERALSDGAGNPCRHCLHDIAQGAPMLILAHWPFKSLHPYAETGPVFVCADPCPRANRTNVPRIRTTAPSYLVKGYCNRDRIVYGTGMVFATIDMRSYRAA